MISSQQINSEGRMELFMTLFLLLLGANSG
nr:MAG TPA: hypothetical protein [Caudoviricetes sp.]DAU13964.1 MAG TPA: hypothetical protein [Bacteriophage sp.]